jgi:hypothetical protein
MMIFTVTSVFSLLTTPIRLSTWNWNIYASLIQFSSLLLMCQVNSYKDNYRHSTVYILVIKYSQIIIVLLILIQLKQIKS